MSNIGSLVVELSANVAKFQSDMGKAAAIAEQRMQQIDKSIGIVKNALAAVGVGFIANATFDKIKQKIDGAIESAAGLKELSERTGATVEALSGLAGIAKMSGADTDALATGLQRLSKTMIDAENGGERTSAAFKAIGISAEEIKGKRPEETFKLVADRLDKYQDGAEKAVIAQELLGKSGANLLPTMKLLADVGGYQTKITTEQSVQAQEYERNLRKLEASTGALYKRVALELVPAFNAFTKALLETQNANDGVRKSVDRLAQNGSIVNWSELAVQAAGYVIDVFEGIGRVFEVTGGALGALGAQVSAVFHGDFAQAKTIAEQFKKEIGDIFAREHFTDRLSRQLNGIRIKPRADDDEKPTPNTSLLGNENLGPKDDPTKKILEGKLKAQEDFIASENKLLQSREQTLEFYAGLEYYSQVDALDSKKALIAENLQAVQAAYAKEEAFLNERINSNAKEVEKADARNKLAEVHRKQLETQTEASAKLTEVEKQRLAIQRQFDLQTQEADRQAQRRNADAQFQIDMLGKSTLEVEKLCAQRQIQLDLEERIYQLRKKDPGADVSKAIEQAERQKAAAGRLIEERYNKERQASFGASEAIRKYGEEAANTAQQIEFALTNAFRSAEDAFVQFVMTGKLSFADLTRSIIAGLVRIQAEKMIAGISGGLGGLVNIGLSAFSGSPASIAATSLSAGMFDNAKLTGMRASGGPVDASGTYLVGEKGPELFRPSNAGTIIPNDALVGGGKQAVNQTLHINIDSRTDRADVQALVQRAVRQGNAQLVDQLSRARKI